ncbi:hypothetical protein HDU92_000094 [Lobulomyces angularis]|nr:hypothetical protein HDU92_000094 [Lobulomyces angularis]
MSVALSFTSADLTMDSLPFNSNLSKCGKDCIGSTIKSLPGAMLSPCDGAVASFFSTCLQQNECTNDSSSLKTLSNLCKEQASTKNASNNNGSGSLTNKDSVNSTIPNNNIPGSADAPNTTGANNSSTPANASSHSSKTYPAIICTTVVVLILSTLM